MTSRQPTEEAPAPPLVALAPVAGVDVLSDMPVGVLVVGAGGQVVFANPRGRTLFGGALEALTDEPFGTVAWGITGIDGAPLTEEQLPHRQVLRAGTQVSGLRVVLTTREQPVHLLLNGAPMETTNGATAQVVLSIQDISEQAQIQLRLDRANRALRVFSAINHALLRAPEREEEFLGRASRIIADEGSFPLVWIGLKDRFAAQLRPAAAAPDSHPTFLDHNVVTWDSHRKTSQGPLGRVMRFGRAVLIADLATDPSFIPWRSEAKQAGFRAMAALPLKTDGEVLGVIAIFASEVETFAPAELRLLVEMSEDVAFGLMSLQANAARRQAEAELNQHREILEMAVEGSRAAPWVLWFMEDGATIDDSRTHLDPRLKAMIGYGPDELPDSIGAWHQRLHPEDRDLVRQAADAHIRGEAGYEVVYRMRHRDGSWRWMASRGRIQRDHRNQPSRWVGMDWDITAERQAEEELRRVHQRLVRIADATHDALWEADLITGTVWRSSALTRLFGYPADPDTQGLAWWQEHIHPEDRDRVRKSFQDALNGDGSEWLDEYRFARSDDTYAYVYDRCEIVRDDQQRPVRVMGGMVDVTRLREVETLNARLEQQTRQLAEVNEELERFAYTVSHDLRAPLRAMVGFSEALVEDYSDSLDELGLDYLGRVVSGSRRLDELICDLLAYSRLGRGDIQLHSIHLGRCLAEVVDSLQATIGAAGAKVTSKALDVHVKADRNVLGQVLANLVGNAVKFVAKGQTPEISVSATTSKGRVRVVVADNGIGIDPAYFEKIFLVFERLHGTEAYPGTGVGLAIVRKGVERMGGTVGIDSAPGEGARFWFELAQGKEEV